MKKTKKTKKDKKPTKKEQKTFFVDADRLVLGRTRPASPSKN
jgi:hypothetical protein